MQRTWSGHEESMERTWRGRGEDVEWTRRGSIRTKFAERESERLDDATEMKTQTGTTRGFSWHCGEMGRDGHGKGRTRQGMAQHDVT